MESQRQEIKVTLDGVEYVVRATPAYVYVEKVSSGKRVRDEAKRAALIALAAKGE